METLFGHTACYHIAWGSRLLIEQCFNLLAIIASSLVGVVVLFLIVCKLLQLRTFPMISAFPGRPERMPLLSHLVLHRSLLRSVAKGYDYSVLYMDFIMGEIDLVYRKYGLYTTYHGPEPTIIIFRADHAEKMLTHTVNLEKGYAYSWLHPWLGEGLLTSAGSKWKSRRKMLTPAFHFRILDDFAKVINRESMVFLEKIASSGPYVADVVPLVSALTLDIVCETIMGVSLKCQSSDRGQKYLSSIKRLGELFLERIQSPSQWVGCLYKISAAGKENARILAHVHKFTKKVIEERKKALEDNPDELKTLESAVDEGMFRSKKPFLDLLLVEHLKKKTMSVDDIREEVDTFMFEGHDTTSMGITFAIYLLGLHPQVQKKIRAEIDEVFEGDDEAEVTAEHVKSLKYLDMVLKETQRLYPSVPIFLRRTVEEMEMMGKPVPPGTNLNLHVYGLHRDPDVFADPEFFDPERFLNQNSCNRSPFAFVPFSAGPRNCIGQKFALLEEKILIVWLLRKFTFQSLDQRDKIILACELVLRPKSPIRVNFIPRK